MSTYPNVTEQNLIILGELDEERKNQQDIQIKNEILKQSHYKKLAESFEPKTKKLKEADKFTEKIGEKFEKTPQPPSETTQCDSQNSERQTPKLVSASDELVKTFGKMNDSIFLKVIPDLEGSFSWYGYDIIPLGEISDRMNVGNYNLTPEFQIAFTDTRYILIVLI